LLRINEWKGGLQIACPAALFTILNPSRFGILSRFLVSLRWFWVSAGRIDDLACGFSPASDSVRGLWRSKK
jgi:hypothetical protein